MSTETSKQLTLAGEKPSDKKTEIIANFVKTPLGKFVLSILGIAVIGGGVAWGMKEAGKNKEAINTPAQQEQTLGGNSINSTEKNTEAPTETIETIPEVEGIDASLINNPEELVKTLSDKMLTEWSSAGATPENNKKAHTSSSGTYESLAAIASAKYDQAYIDKLMAKDWESNAFNKKFVDNIISIHSYNVASYYRNNSYKSWTTSSNIKKLNGSEAEGYITVSFTNTRHNSVTADQTSADGTFRLVKEGDYLKIDEVLLDKSVEHTK